jgi:hypothetical protein
MVADHQGRRHQGRVTPPDDKNFVMANSLWVSADIAGFFWLYAYLQFASLNCRIPQLQNPAGFFVNDIRRLLTIFEPLGPCHENDTESWSPMSRRGGG